MSEQTLHERAETLRGHKFIRNKRGRMLTFWDAIRDLETGQATLSRGFSRAFKLADDYGLEVLDRHIEQVEDHMAALRAYLEKLRGHQSKRERIALLRNVNGRSPAEAEAFLRKADELEGEL